MGRGQRHWQVSSQVKLCPTEDNSETITFTVMPHISNLLAGPDKKEMKNLDF
jgi:hypothetical protein